ncbi:MAG: hypothetical protein AAF628_08110 [Planctomycetota bacterium]
MLKWILHKAFTRFGTTYDYDTSYLHGITDVSAGAAARYLALPLLSQMKQPAPEVWAGAALASTLEGDCGPCLQLIVNIALETGIDADKIRACLSGDLDTAGDVGLGFRFARAAIEDDATFAELRDEISASHGDKAVIAASYATATCRSYPVMKRGLGYGHACRAVTVEGVELALGR